MANFGLALALPVFLLSALAQKSGTWTCESDGFWYENGVKSSYSGCSGDKSALDKTDSYTAGAGKSGEKTDTYTGYDKDSSTGSTDKSGATTDSKTAGGTDGNYGWTCTNGFWVDAQGVASTYSCQAGSSLKDPEYGDKSAGNGCTVTSQRATAMASMPRTCIQHPSYADGRCWWTHVPSTVATATDGRKVPLLVDMHGGGGCASDQYSSSGFRGIADSDATGIVVVWPQGGLGGLWASAGTSTRTSTGTSSGKALPEWSDIGFLEQLVSYMIRNSSIKEKIDPEKVYLSGFSLGCMMAHRFAMERSQLVAAFGCHGGELSLAPTTVAEMDADSATYNIQPMPVYLTIGDADAWYPGANTSWYAWKYWNQCTGTSTTPLSSVTGATENVAHTCRSHLPALQTVMTVISGGLHVPNLQAYQRIWSWISQYKRTGALAAISAVPSVALQPDAPAEVVAAKDGTAGVKTTVGSHAFQHTWNSVLKTRRYDMVQPAGASCSGNPRGMVVIFQPEGGSCTPLESLATGVNCIMVVCPYSEGPWKSFSPADTEDVEFVAALIQNITTVHSVPAGKVLITGFSFGGSMAFRMACVRSDVVGALAPYGQTFFEPASGHVPKGNQDLSMSTTQQAIQMMDALQASDRCNPTTKRPHFALVGAQDGYYGQVGGTYQGKTLWERYSTTVLGCSGTPSAGTPAAGNAMTGRANSACYGYSTCTGVDPSLNKYCTVEGMAHETTGWAGFVEQAFNQIWGASVITPSPAASPTPSPAASPTPSGNTDGAEWQHGIDMLALAAAGCGILSSFLV